MLQCEDREALEAILDEGDGSVLYDLPIFGAPKVFEPFSLNAQGRSFSVKSSASPSPSPSRSRTASPTSSRFYCQSCRKSFSSKSTWDSHCKSSKHISNLASQGVKRSPNTMISDPTLKHVVESIDKAKRIASARPEIAITVLWNIVQDLAETEHHRNLFDALYALREVLQSAPDLSNAPSSISEQVKAEMTFKADFAMARLFARTDEMEAALPFYLSALQRHKYPILLPELLHLARHVTLWSHDAILSEIRMRISTSYLEWKDKSIFLMEAASFFSQQSSNYDLEGHNHACNIAIILYTSVLYDGTTDKDDMCCSYLSMMYDRLDMPWASFDCLMKLHQRDNCPSGCIALLKAGTKVLKLEDRLRKETWLNSILPHHQIHLDLMVMERRLHSQLSGGVSLIRNWHDVDMIESLIQIEGNPNDSTLVLHFIPSPERGYLWLEFKGMPR